MVRPLSHANLTRSPKGCQLQFEVELEKNSYGALVEIGRERSAQASACFIRIEGSETSKGSGCLVTWRGSQFVLTNNHVLPTVIKAQEAIAHFNYDADIAREDVVRVALEPNLYFRTSDRKELDVTIVALKSPIGSLGVTLADDLISPSPKINTPIVIYQHPNGKPKCLARQHVISLTEKYLRYTADTLPGSSGAPIFDHQYDLVGIHHAADAKNDPPQYNEGIRFDKILEWLRQQPLPPDDLPSLIRNLSINHNRKSAPAPQDFSRAMMSSAPSPLAGRRIPRAPTTSSAELGAV